MQTCTLLTQITSYVRRMLIAFFQREFAIQDSSGSQVRPLAPFKKKSHELSNSFWFKILQR